jgi:hypothetical protein
MASGLLPKSPVSSSLCDEVPHIFIPKSHLEPREFLISSAKRLLQQYLPLADSCTAAKSISIRSPRRHEREASAVRRSLDSQSRILSEVKIYWPPCDCITECRTKWQWGTSLKCFDHGFAEKKPAFVRNNSVFIRNLGLTKYVTLAGKTQPNPQHSPHFVK